MSFLYHVNAWSLLPAFCGLRPGGERYEIQQARGDVVGIPSSTTKIFATTQKPVTLARLEILGPEKFDAALAAEDMGPEIVRRTVTCTLGDDKKLAVGLFDMQAE